MLTSPICHTEISHKVKYFRLTDFKSRRRGWSPAEADEKGGLSGLQETLYQIIKSPLQPFDYVAKIHKKNSEKVLTLLAIHYMS